MTLDEARARHPMFGFAVFAMDPREPVTLEVYTPDGNTHQWRGASEAEVLGKAFPAQPAVSQTPPSPALPAGSGQPTAGGEPPEQVGGVAETAGGVFD